jgi:hypothetical protein
MRTSRFSGELFHGKYVLQPNSLGYCGPDENSNILEHLHNSSVDDELKPTLMKFEAAYPFIKMIAKSTGRNPFDRDVTEAYWIGNSLLDKVEPSDFFEFTHRALKSRIRKADAKRLFRKLGPLAKPHHTFYVLGMYSQANVKPSSEEKLLELMDSCRISWGQVVEVKEKTLVVQRAPLAISNSNLSLTRSEKREVKYDWEVPPFSTVKKGDWVSLHWNFASDRLTLRQLKNLRRYTALDIQATNRLVNSALS